MKRIEIEVNGIVQGVGFRPFIHKLVKDYQLAGWVKNTSTGVLIELEGDECSLLKFVKDIKIKSPKLALIERVTYKFHNDLKKYNGFEIIKSTTSSEKFTLISPDVCICDDCLRELFDKSDRRYRFPFINCTNCGPRFSIIKDIPYDRDKTTMREFPMCSECNEEYKNIENRRYHAQPDCCFTCGPKLFFVDSGGKPIGMEPIREAQRFIREGKIIAVKGLGGFHLACNAKNEETVFKLRKVKHRDEKPFAIMCRDVETVKRYCFLSDEEEKILTSFRRPIVLLRKKNDSLNGVSIDNNLIGVMLPYTPVHYIIMEDDIDTLVMTSANLSDLPIVFKNDEALRDLSDIADGFLMNNRDINVRCDDSLMMVFEGKEYPIRRSRGYVPFPIKVSQNIGEVLACGAEQKASFALSKDSYIFLSQHIGDLKNIETLEHYQNQIKHFKRLFSINIEKIACDLHPDYMSTEYAEVLGKKLGIEPIYIQHHHAHMASCMADNNINEKVIGIIWDGTGYGTDGTIWGGEFFTGDYNSFERVGHIEEIPLPGGDKAVKDIYRIGYSLIKSSMGYIPDKFKKTQDLNIIEGMIDKKINTPHVSSIGRLFDGVAAVLGMKYSASYEGQGAVILESRALDSKESYSYNIESLNGMNVFNWKPMIKEIIQDIETGYEPGVCAAKFMNTLIKMAVTMSEIIRNKTGINTIVLSGGVFQNLYILDNIKKALIDVGFMVYTHSRVSTNDEGISLGQLLIAANGGGVNVLSSTT